MNTEELASIYHLPSVAVETPNIVWAGSKKGEPPSNLPLEGRDLTNEVTYFGTTDFRNFRHKFGIKSHDRRLHMYTIGKTGTGKSTLLMNMILDDIQKGRGVGVVDPHGQLIYHILQRIPPHRINDVIYFNPADREYPIGFNVLENINPDLRNVVASGVISIFKKLFAESWGPRLEYILRNALIALLHYPDTTLLGVNRMLVDPAYEHRILRKVTDPVVRDFFENEYDKYDPKFRREAIASIQNKIGQFLSTATIRNILGQPNSTIDIRKIMDNQKIFLMDLSIGKIGEDSAALLGALLITKIQLAAMGRADVPEEERLDFYLYVDEFQNFATESFAIILSEARKYHLNLVLTNQYIAQMSEIVAKAVFGNVGTIVSFRVGPSDAGALVKEFEPVFEAIDLINLDNFHVYVKMAIDGVTRPAFSAKTLPPGDLLEQGNLEKIVRVSRERFAKSRDVVEGKILEWADQRPEDQKPNARDEKNFLLNDDVKIQSGQGSGGVVKKYGDFVFVRKIEAKKQISTRVPDKVKESSRKPSKKTNFKDQTHSKKPQKSLIRDEDIDHLRQMAESGFLTSGEEINLSPNPLSGEKGEEGDKLTR
ncbi:type IV secretory system conjugative DNA transfer family protein [Candidatus Berkelbacteria bacterium]|nr:type IV secretory system conjugative DNA transfer family protein [Candidatus Berkelbacteria bacterium]